MANFGFVRVAAATPSVKVADCDYNTQEILKMVSAAEKQNVSAIAFPELCITSYTANDLLNQQILIEAALSSLERICNETKNLNIITIVGSPIKIKGKLYNTSVVIHKGEIRGIVPKTFLPNYNEFYDKRWFSSPGELTENRVVFMEKEVPVGTNIIFETPDYNFALEICEDLWAPVPPSSFHSLYGADIIFNLSASNDTVGKHVYRKSLISQQSARCICGYVYAAAGNGESTTDIVFGGDSIIAEDGSILAEAKRFSFDSQLITTEIDIDKIRNDRQKNTTFSVDEYRSTGKIDYQYVKLEQQNSDPELQRPVNPTPFVPGNNALLNERCEEIFSIQVGGLAKRLLHTDIRKTVIGISGGLDSTLALLVMAKAYDKLNISRDNIVGITMPGFGTTDRTYNNAIALMDSLGITSKEISIVPAINQHFKDIEQDANTHDTTYENSQARERTQILMDYANKINGLVIGTGDLSELALGWCTYNGDHMSMYALNTSIPKTLVYTLVRWVADTQMDETSKAILYDIVDTPVSPELLPTGENGEIVQITEEVVGPYILHDFFLYNVLRFGFTPAKIYFLAQHAFKGEYTKDTILKWLKVFFRRFFTQQFKRSCLPDGPKVGSVNLSPRGDWRMVSDASAALWLKQLDELD